MNRILLSTAVLTLALAAPVRAQSVDDADDWAPWSEPPSVDADSAPDLGDAPEADLAADEGAEADAEWSVAADAPQWTAEPPPPPPLPGPAEPAAPQLTAPATQPTQQDFQAALDPYGSWLEEPGLGWVWQPSAGVVGPDFVPYVTNGSWSYCDGGWGFVSGWSWGWAPFHYGRWYQHRRLGWVWWPSYRWAPAWVDWRLGGGYVGWAPLPPPGISVGFGVGAPGWSFAAWRSFNRPAVARYVIHPEYGAAWGNRGGWGWARGGSTWHGSAPVGDRHADGLSSGFTRPGGGFAGSRGAAEASHGWAGVPHSGGGFGGGRGWSGGSHSSGAFGGGRGWSGGTHGAGGFAGARGFSGGHGGGFHGGGGHRR